MYNNFSHIPISVGTIKVFKRSCSSMVITLAVSYRAVPFIVAASFICTFGIFPCIPLLHLKVPCLWTELTSLTCYQSSLVSPLNFSLPSFLHSFLILFFSFWFVPSSLFFQMFIARWKRDQGKHVEFVVVHFLKFSLIWGLGIWQPFSILRPHACAFGADLRTGLSPWKGASVATTCTPTFYLP